MLNTAVIMGRLTADPELRHTPQGIAVTRFTVAVDRAYQKAGTERQADFIDVVCWRQTAEFVTRYFRKGSMIGVEGSIQTGSYEKDGIRRRTFEIVANNVSFCGSKRETDSGNASSVYNAAPATNTNASYTSADTGDFEEITGDDDLPF